MLGGRPQGRHPADHEWSALGAGQLATASDVIGITAASKDVATIFTAGGVNYSTFDGGSNWEQAN